MKTRFFFILTVSCLMTLSFLTNTFAQDSPQWQLPAGARARLGKGSVGEIAYSPNGSRLAMASSLGIWIYDAATGDELALLIGHTRGVDSIAFSPDGTILASGGAYDDTVRLWDIATGQQKSVFRGHRNGVDSIAFSPDGNTIASGSSDISGRGRDDTGTVRLWDVATGREKAVFKDHDGIVPSVAFSPDSRLIASGGLDKVVLRNAITGEHEYTLDIDFYAWDIAFSPDGNTLATQSDSRSEDQDHLALWDVTTGERKAIFGGPAHARGVFGIAFSPDGRTIASAGPPDDTVRLWNVATGEERAVLIGHTGYVNNVAYSPDGSMLATSSWADSTVRLWDAATRDIRNTLTGYTGWVFSVAFSPDGSTLATGSSDTIVRLWDVRLSSFLNMFTGHTNDVRSVAYSPDGSTLASASWDNTVRLWNATTGTPINTLTEHTDDVDSVAYSPDGSTLASASWDNTVRLWNATTGTPINTLIGHTDRVHSVVYSPDGNTIASASTDNTVRLWDAITGAPLNTLTEHTDRVYSVAYSPDGNTIASGSWDNTVRLWNATTGTPLNTLIGHTDRVYSVAYSPDGNTIASGGGPDDTAVRLWDAATGRLLNTLIGHTSYVRSVVFSPDGTILASGSTDSTVLLWPHTLTTPLPSDPLDVNGDGQVTVIDLAIVALFYGTQVPVGINLPADVNADSVVNLLDLTAVAQAIDAGGGLNQLSLWEVEAALLAAINQVADLEGIAGAPMSFGTRQHALSGNTAYRNVATALADASLARGIPAGLSELLQLFAEMVSIPEKTMLLPNYPNPFNPETWIPYHLAKDAVVTLTIYDASGSTVRELLLGHQAAGVYESRGRAVYWDGKNQIGEKVASGLYFYTLTAGDFTATRKLLIRK